MLKPSPVHQTKEQHSYRSLRDATVRGGLAPGEQLVIGCRSAELGVKFRSVWRRARRQAAAAQKALLHVQRLHHCATQRHGEWMLPAR